MRKGNISASPASLDMPSRLEVFNHSPPFPESKGYIGLRRNSIRHRLPEQHNVHGHQPSRYDGTRLREPFGTSRVVCRRLYTKGIDCREVVRKMHRHTGASYAGSGGPTVITFLEANKEACHESSSWFHLILDTGTFQISGSRLCRMPIDLWAEGHCLASHTQPTAIIPLAACWSPS